MLESAGVRVITAAGGHEAIALARKHLPQVIFMDVRMADLDGLEATRRLKADAATNVIPVIAVTASAFGDTRAAALEAGCVDYLPKPVRAEDLFAALRTHLGVRFVSATDDRRAPGGADRRRRAAPARHRGPARRGGHRRHRSPISRRSPRSWCRAVPAEAALGRRMAALVTAFDFDGLRALAASLAAGRGLGPVTSLPGRPQQPPPPATILVVDDSPVNLQVLVRTLHGTGHRILAARDGRTALDIVRRARPDLVLLDVMMPDMDGFEVCRTLKADPVTQETVVIFLSALGDVADKVAGLQLGAVDYVTKPIQPDEVLARVANHLTRLQSRSASCARSRDRLDRELESAGRMQRLILPPSLPSAPGRRVRGQLPDEPPCRRRLLRRAHRWDPAASG